jgi:3-hydroxyisobutyrate dehydrogenase-like beta-hydroxyacid dehydrogenase
MIIISSRFAQVFGTGIFYLNTVNNGSGSIIMSKLTMVGLGAMGATVAQTLIENGHDLTVWNRSIQKTQGIVELGGNCANTLKEAIEASQIIIFCIHGYKATKLLLNDPDIVPLLSGRTILQMSTGTPAEAREAEAWVNEQGGHYLDCAIMVYPPSVGKPDGQILISGAAEVYEKCAPFIKALGGDIRYLGPAVGAAAALDMAIVMRLVTITVATVYGIHICESEGVPLQQFTDMYPAGDRSHHLAMNIETGQFEQNIVATVGTSIEVVSAIQSLAIDLGINTELPDLLLGFYRRAATAGCTELDNASLIKVFRATRQKND